MDSARGFLPSCHPCPAHQACWGSGSLGHSRRKPAARATPSASHSPYSISWSPHPTLSMSQAQLKDHHPHPRTKHREMSKAGEGSLGTPGGLAQRLPFWPPKDEATKGTRSQALCGTAFSKCMSVGSESPTRGLRTSGKALTWKRRRLLIFSEGPGMNPFGMCRF